MVFSMDLKFQRTPVFFSIIAVFLFLISSIFTYADATSRLMRYENLYKIYKCTFPPSNSMPPLFGKESYLSKCDSVGDPLSKAGGYNLSASLCQSLLDELLIICHGTPPGVSTKATVLLSGVKNMSAAQLCQDPVIKKHHADNDWKLLNEPSICPGMCGGDKLWICRIRVFLWKYSDAVAADTSSGAKKAENSTSNSTFQNTTSKPAPNTTSAEKTTTVKPKIVTANVDTDATTTTSPLPTTEATKKSFEETMKNALKNKPPSSGSQANDDTPGSVSHISIHDAAKGSSRVGAKLFILFGVCSLIFVVVGYVMFYKRKQIRAFCCEDQGDVRYRRIREDRNQQAAQPLKNMNF